MHCARTSAAFNLESRSGVSVVAGETCEFIGAGQLENSRGNGMEAIVLSSNGRRRSAVRLESYEFKRNFD